MYSKKGFPKKNEIVITTITRVLPHSVFVKLEEYNNLEGMIHTSEMERRIVRNMRTFFKIGRELVCKVIDVNESKKQISLSLRRVGASQTRTKEKEWKNEKRADEILNVFSKIHKIDINEVYSKFADKILNKYGLLYPAFTEISRGNEEILDELKIEPNLKKKIIKLISERITTPRITAAGQIEISCSAPNGLEIIKKAFKLAQKYAKENKFTLNVIYSGAPTYKIKIETEDKKHLEKKYTEMLEVMKKFLSKNKGVLVKKSEIHN